MHYSACCWSNGWGNEWNGDIKRTETRECAEEGQEKMFPHNARCS